jgi:hypothetical protein
MRRTSIDSLIVCVCVCACIELLRHLDGTILLQTDGSAPQEFQRPSLMITDAFNAQQIQPSRLSRDKALLGNHELHNEYLAVIFLQDLRFCY